MAVRGCSPRSAAAAALALIHVDRTVLNADGFAGRADAAL